MPVVPLLVLDTEKNIKNEYHFQSVFYNYKTGCTKVTMNTFFVLLMSNFKCFTSKESWLSLLIRMNMVIAGVLGPRQAVPQKIVPSFLPYGKPWGQFTKIDFGLKFGVSVGVT